MGANGSSSYDKLKKLSRETGANRDDLIALTSDNDPFYIGTDLQHEMGEWFKGEWRERGFLGRGGVHLRRAHYQMLGTTKHNGEIYENDTASWKYLLKVSKFARILGYVNPEDIIDRRNPEPHIYYFRPGREQEKGFEAHIPNMQLPEPDTDLLSWLDEDLKHPHLTPTGYDYDDFYQPYHCEIWVEKSTMNDILIPLCRRLGTNLVTGVGYMTITSVVSLLRRIEASGKPTRLLYVSDFDHAGKGMPKAVARQTEFWMAKYATEADIRLEPIVLTQEQIDEHELPSLNIVEGESGEPPEDVVELDALEAKVPGKLAEIVAEHINQFRDDDLAEKFSQARDDAQLVLDDALEEHLEDDLAALDELKEEARPTIERYERLLERLSERLQRELEPIQVRLDETRHAIAESVSSLEPPLPDLPEPAAPNADEDGWLFDSRRKYMEQLKHYKTPEEWGEMHSRIRARQKVCPECGTSFVAKHMERAVYCSKNCRQRGNRKLKSASYLKRKAKKRESQ